MYAKYQEQECEQKHEIHLLLELAYVTPFVGSLKEENSCVNWFEFPTDV
jgi:hypothetical protein